MTRQRTTALCKCTLIAVTLQVAPLGVLVGQDTQIKMRQYVLAQALTELATRAHVQPSAVEAGAVRLERVTGIAEGLDLWRVRSVGRDAALRSFTSVSAGIRE